MLTDEQVAALSPTMRAIYFKQLQIDAVGSAMKDLAKRFIPTDDDAEEIDIAIGELEIKHNKLMAEFNDMVKDAGSIQALTQEEVDEMKAAITALSAAVAASKAASEIIELATTVANEVV